MAERLPTKTSMSGKRVDCWRKPVAEWASTLSRGSVMDNIATDLRDLQNYVDLADQIRPKVRRDCENAIRPCPFVGCRYHLYLDVTKAGSIKYNFPGVDVTEMPFSCALDVADQKGMILDSVAMFLNVTRERVRQIAEIACEKLGLVINNVEDSGDLKEE